MSEALRSTATPRSLRATVSASVPTARTSIRLKGAASRPTGCLRRSARCGGLSYLDSRFRLAMEHSRMRRVIPAEACVTVASDRVTFRYTDCEGLSAEASREGVFEPAGDPAKMADGLRTQAARKRRYAVRRTAGGGDGCRVVRSSFAGRCVAARSVAELRRLRVARVPRTPDSCRRPVCALSCCGAFGRRECYQPACGTFLPRPRGDAHRAGARPRSLDGGPAGDAFDLLHPSRDRRMPAGRFAPRRRSLSVRGAKRYRLAFDCARCEMSLIDEK